MRWWSGLVAPIMPCASGNFKINKKIFCTDCFSFSSNTRQIN